MSEDFLIRVSKRIHVPPSVVQSVLNVAIDEMGWPEINAFNEERAKGQSIYEDAGGYCLRFIGRLFGAKPKDAVVTYREAMTAMLAAAESTVAETK